MLGPNNKVLFMANHGVLVIGETVAEAYDRLYYLERACQVQLYAMWTGRSLKRVPPRWSITLCANTPRRQLPGKPAWEHHFAALKRLLDRCEPDYSD